MPTRSSDSAISGGSCGFYGGSKSGVERSCYDCLNHVVDNEPQGCKVTESGKCVSQSAESSGTTGTYCEPDSVFCFQCLSMQPDVNTCEGWSDCICIRQCEAPSKLEWGLKIGPRSYNFIIGVVTGFLVVIAFFTFCVYCMVRRRQRELNSNGAVARAVAYENQRVLQSGEPLQRFHDSPSGTQNFGHHAVVMDTFADPSSTFSSDAPYTQAFDTTPSVPDCTPSAPAFESNSISAPTTSYSSYD